MSELKYHPPAARAAAKALCEAALDGFIEPARRVARDCGYAIAVHGSLAKDIDLVAIPWTDRACDPDMLVDKVAAVIGGQFGRCNPARHGGPKGNGWFPMPHGRQAIQLLIWSDLFGSIDVDLSVFAPHPKPEGDAGKPE
jgi:hypothetical protein